MLAKQVTTNPQIKNLIEKYEEQQNQQMQMSVKQHNGEQQSLIFEEIKEEVDGEELDEDTAIFNEHRSKPQMSMEEGKVDSPKDASGDNIRQFIPTSMSGGMSPSPNVSSPMLYQDRIPSSSLLENIKSQEKIGIIKVNSNRPSTRFELAF